MSKYLEKVQNFRKIIKQNGGVMGSLLQLYRTDELKWGDLVGEDKYGNKYYQNKYYFVGRSRWVMYKDSAGMDYDGSMIPPEWHRWLHYIGDEPPTKVAPVTRKWMIDHEENMSGTPGQYVPYSTTRPKIESWVPPRSSQS
ncbi:NADH dehydrogenase [ubiquinone] 1 alpha subcomplex subunit 12-like [Liolophura sinensis]|uniref:NADH dehydrogenase [ubiquinone] 1 alpha subcomplex subunit 12-like n=1 Tax=Liolophura sinensis TaxID=3198878 RepID=UPI003158C837